MLQVLALNRTVHTTTTFMKPANIYEISHSRLCTRASPLLSS